MDKEQARFILHSFRPDGADANDHDFAEALALAMEDRELCEWLANERAFDAGFAKALAAVKLPEDLRLNIIGCLAAERGGIPQADDNLDCALIGAVSLIQAPPELRMQVLTAMERTITARVPRKPFLQRLAMPLAAAAGVALAFFLTNNSGQPEITADRKLPVDVVQANFIRAFESPDFTLDEKREDHRELIKNLKERKLPCPCSLPDGLAKMKGIGCRELVINGKHGSLICFDERTKGVVHLVVFRREDVDGDLPDNEHPQMVQNGRWATASWQHHQNVFILIAATDVQKLASLF
ncbi:MAG: hypothetical protein WCS43_10165 [Verrucomicrobiota bacterium]